MSLPATSEPVAINQSTVRTNCIVALFPQLQGTGGVQEAGRLTAAALQEISEAQGATAEILSLNDALGVHRIEVAGRAIRFRGFGRMKARFVLSCVRHARRFERSHNGIVLAAHPHLAVPAIITQKLLSHIKVIVMSHGVEVWEPMAKRRRRALQRATMVLAPSHDTAQKVIQVQEVMSGKVRQLAWPLSPQFAQMADVSSNLALPPRYPNGQVVLTVGRWRTSERYKGTDALIRSVARLRSEFPALHLVAVGGGDDLPRLKRLALDLGISDATHFWEGLSREDLAACYAHAEIFALPSTGEGFGLVFLEAMAFAKPVIGAAAGGAIDVIQDGVNGFLVPPNDADHLARALSCLLRDHSLREQLGCRGAEIVREKYQFGIFRVRLEQILAECGWRNGRVK